jgi:hypothetical protein
VIAWNGVHGASSHSHRHEQLCDTSHCMVFLGHSESQRKLLVSPAARLDTDSFAFLRDVSNGGRQWFPFSAGGELQWEQQVSGERIAQIAKEPAVLGLRREVRRTGEVFVRLVYESGEESVPCEQIMTMLDLPSCPDRVRPVDGGHYLFSGIGRGHGRGLSVERARSLSLRGVSASEILRDAYGVKQELSGALVSR